MYTVSFSKRLQIKCSLFYLSKDISAADTFFGNDKHEKNLKQQGNVMLCYLKNYLVNFCHRIKYCRAENLHFVLLYLEFG